MATPLEGAGAAPAPALGFPREGVSLAGILAFVDAAGGRGAFEGLTTADVCASGKPHVFADALLTQGGVPML